MSSKLARNTVGLRLSAGDVLVLRGGLQISTRKILIIGYLGRSRIEVTVHKVRSLCNLLAWLSLIVLPACVVENLPPDRIGCHGVKKV